MIVYLAVPISFGRDLRFANSIAKAISELGHKISSRWVLEEDPSWGLSPEEIYERDLKGIERSDVLVADISRPSIGVGMEMMYAILHGKEVICITKRGIPISGLVLGSDRARILILDGEEELKRRLKELIGDERGEG